MSTLEQDYTTVPGQLYACLSVIGPEAPQKNDKFGIKIRGAFNSRDEAASHAKRLQKEDATFDIYVVDMYKWLLIPPDPTKIEDVHYSNEKLEELMSGYKENQAQAAHMFAERKRDMVESAPTFTKPGDENSKYYTKPDEPPISHPAEVLERLQKEKREAEAKDALEKEASEKGFNSVEAMQKFEKEKSESSTEAQDTKGEGEVEEGEEVESK